MLSSAPGHRDRSGEWLCRGAADSKSPAAQDHRVGRQRPLHQPHRRHTVDQRVVELAVEGEPAVVQALDEVGLPQRAVPVEQAAVHREVSSSSSRTRPGDGSAERRT